MPLPPRSVRRAGLLALAAALLALACGGERSDESSSAGGPPLRALDEATLPPPTAADESGCPMRGSWRACSVVERLERAGFGVAPLGDSVRHPRLGITGRAYRVSGAELHVFLYADSADARRASVAVVPRDLRASATRGIRRPPAVIHSQNLVALLFNNNDHQLERVQLALTAGLPAP
jgi:hypothetical protein